MYYEDGYRDVSLADWEQFRVHCDGPLSSWKVFNRFDAGLFDGFLPLARGVVVATPRLFQRIGYLVEDPFVEMDNGGFYSHQPLKVRLWEDANPQLWSVERWMDDTYQQLDEVLVLEFGATPVFATSHRMAKELALHCHSHGALPGTRWLKAPKTPEALQRQMDYATARDGLAIVRILSAQVSQQAH